MYRTVFRSYQDTPKVSANEERNRENRSSPLGSKQRRNQLIEPVFSALGGRASDFSPN
jgi:hypothetical protein